MKLIPSVRRKKIKESIKRKGNCTISELSALFNISNSTVYRDLKKLEKEGLVKRISGGAKAVGADFFEVNFKIRLKINYEKKLEIAKKAVKIINDNDSIFLDASSTCFVLAKEISKYKFKNLTIVTNSPAIVYDFSDIKNISVISTGGYLEPQLSALSGPWALEFLSKLHIDKSFISCAGISLERGLMTSQMLIVEMLKKIIEVSHEIYILVDSEKFSKKALLQISTLEKINKVITDSDLSQDVINKYRDYNIKLI